VDESNGFSYSVNVGSGESPRRFRAENFPFGVYGVLLKRSNGDSDGFALVE
jgi:hypothetical protein